MAEHDQAEGRQPTSSDFDTDAIVDVYEHLLKNSKTWAECMAGHGLDPKKVSRAIDAIVPKGDGRTKAATQTFVLGLQLGAMRLEPIEYDPKAADVCGCFFCTIRRAAEAEAAESEGGGPK